MHSPVERVLRGSDPRERHRRREASLQRGDGGGDGGGDSDDGSLVFVPSYVRDLCVVVALFADF